MKQKIQFTDTKTPALKKFIDSFESFASIVDDEMLILDKDFRVIRANDSFLRKRLWTQEEVVGRSCFAVSHGFKAPCATFGELCPLVETLSTGLPSRVTHVHKDRNGQESYVDIVTSPIKDDSGSVVGALEMMRDVTKEKVLEKELKHRNDDLSILNAIIVAGNRGFTLEEVLASAMVEIFGSKRVDAGWIILKDEETGKPKLVEHRGVSKEFVQALIDVPLEDSLCAQVATTGRPLYMPDFSGDERIDHPIIKSEGLGTFMCVPLRSHDKVLGSFTFVRREVNELSPEEKQFLEVIGEQLGVIVDKVRLYSALQRYADELLEGRRRREEFSNMVSHELKSVVSILSGYAQLLQRADKLDEPKFNPKRALHSIVSQSNRLTRLVDDLRDVSAIEAGRFTLRKERFDLFELTHQVVEQQQLLTDDHTISLIPSKSNIGGVWDWDRIRQVLENLLSNAVKYSPEGGDIMVSLESGENVVTVTVKDQGLGIPQEELGRIFQPYVRAHKEIKGIGLGLYICKGIVEAHGGRIWAESGPGKGSTFRFTLPAK